MDRNKPLYADQQESNAKQTEDRGLKSNHGVQSSWGICCWAQSYLEEVFSCIHTEVRLCHMICIQGIFPTCECNPVMHKVRVIPGIQKATEPLSARSGVSVLSSETNLKFVPFFCGPQRCVEIAALQESALHVSQLNLCSFMTSVLIAFESHI